MTIEEAKNERNKWDESETVNRSVGDVNSQFLSTHRPINRSWGRKKALRVCGIFVSY